MGVKGPSGFNGFLKETRQREMEILGIRKAHILSCTQIILSVFIDRRV